MIKDDAFFGYARSGELNAHGYPCMLESGKAGDLEAGEHEIKVLGRSVKKTIFYPDYLKYQDSEKFYEVDDLVVIPNGIELIQRPARLLQVMSEARGRFGFKKILYAQGVADPYVIPALVYAGVQLFDDSYPKTEGLQKIKYTLLGKIKTQNDSSSENVAFVKETLELLKASIENSTLREVVEKLSVSSKSVEILRILDSYYYREMERVFPIRTPYIKANGIESLERPDLKRYREIIGHNFRKPEELKIALVLPCSARKPYSTSRSHQAILNRISPLRKYIHEIIITSPVGLVPRELEESYPARFYDVPVIGLWFEDEKKMMSQLVSEYFGNNKYENVIAFLPKDLEFLREVLPEGTKFIENKGSSDNNISELRSSIEKAAEETGKSRCMDRKLESYKIIAEYQFGRWIRPYLEGMKIINSYNQDMLARGGKIFLVYNKELGKFTINKESGEFFMKEGRYTVEIDDFKPTSNIYPVGVLNCTEDVRPEDEVVIIHNNEVRGSGIAKMPGKAMNELKKGVAVKVRN